MSDGAQDVLDRLARQRGDGCPSDDALAAYLQQALPADAQAALDAHLQTCPACINRLIDARELETAAHATEPLPPRLQARVRASVAASLAGPSPRPARSSARGMDRLRSLLRPRALGAIGAAAVMALAVAVTLLLPPAETPPDLTPRGTPLDVRLESLRPAVTPAGILLADEDGAWQVSISAQTRSGVAVARIQHPASTLPAASRAGLTAGAALIVLPVQGETVNAEVQRVQDARWQDADGGAHQGQLLEFSASRAEPGAALLTADLRLAGLCVAFDPATSLGLAVPIMEINQEISREREKNR